MFLASKRSKNIPTFKILQNLQYYCNISHFLRPGTSRDFPEISICFNMFVFCVKTRENNTKLLPPFKIYQNHWFYWKKQHIWLFRKSLEVPGFRKCDILQWYWRFCNVLNADIFFDRFDAKNMYVLLRHDRVVIKTAGILMFLVYGLKK